VAQRVLLNCNFLQLLLLLLLLQCVVVEILLEHGADIEAKTRNGETALGVYSTVVPLTAF